MEEAKVPFVGMSLAGRILVARPDLPDPRFHATMMLLLEHGDEGALAVVLNRPSDVELADAFPDWEDLSAEPRVVFAGGPVDGDALIALGRPTQEPGQLVLGAHPVDLDQQPALVGKILQPLQVCGPVLFASLQAVFNVLGNNGVPHICSFKACVSGYYALPGRLFDSPR